MKNSKKLVRNTYKNKYKSLSPIENQLLFIKKKTAPIERNDERRKTTKIDTTLPFNSLTSFALISRAKIKTDIMVNTINEGVGSYSEPTVYPTKE